MPYLATEDGWVCMRSLSEEEQLAALNGAVSAAVEGMHARGVVHGDLRNSNVMLKRVKDTWEVKFVDLDCECLWLSFRHCFLSPLLSVCLACLLVRSLARLIACQSQTADLTDTELCSAQRAQREH